MTYSLRVADMPSSERPRERLVQHGARPLSNAELIAVLLRTGQGAGKLSAVGLGHHLLQVLGEDLGDPLGALRQISVNELTRIPGVGETKAATILAAIELGKRVYQSRPAEKTVVDDPAIAAALLSQDLMWQTQEKFAVLLLDVKHRFLGLRVLTMGTATETLAHPREIFREPIRQGATRIIVSHNHPSGNTDPSPEDVALTRQLLQGGQLLGIPILDHLILGNGDFLSLRQHTALWKDYPQGD